jgi:tetratricopeptide (TPR) repeat protein
MEAILGHREEAVHCAEHSVELMPESADALDGVGYAKLRAKVYDWIGDKEKALAEYKRLLRVPSPFFLNVHEMKHGYSSLRGDPRFEALLTDPQNNAPLF